MRIVKPSNLSRTSIEKLAANIFKKESFNFSGDVHALVQTLGGRISLYHPYCFLDTTDNYMNAVEIFESRNFKINIPNHFNEKRIRIETAIALGHYVIHYAWEKMKTGKCDKLLIPRYKNDKRVTHEAVWFGTSLLIPENELAYEIISGNSNLVCLSDKFKVPELYMDIRLKTLNLKQIIKVA